MFWSHSIRAALATLAVALPLTAAAQQPPLAPPLPDAGATNFTIFLRGAPIGTEQIALTRTASGWTIASSGRLGAPRRPELAIVHPLAVRVSAICSVPIGAPRRKIVKLVAPASGSGGASGGCCAAAVSGSATASVASAARIE